MPTIFTLRRATANDKAFVDNLLFASMQEYVEATWPSDPVAQKRYYEINSFDPSNTSIVQAADKAIGRLSLTIRADCIFVEEIHLLPEFRGRGIGTQLLQGVLELAAERRLPVRLTVLAANPAQNLYRRMGFELFKEQDHRLHMNYGPLVMVAQAS
jgi:ribosomal protein S18 acetylase RimI-like enzyme